jgi:hypothetical protein
MNHIGTKYDEMKINGRRGRTEVGYLSDRDRFDGDHDLGIVGSALGQIECEFPFPLRKFKVLATNESLTTAAAPKSSLPNRLLHHHKPCQSVRNLRQTRRKVSEEMEQSQVTGYDEIQWKKKINSRETCKDDSTVK